MRARLASKWMAKVSQSGDKQLKINVKRCKAPSRRSDGARRMLVTCPADWLTLSVCVLGIRVSVDRCKSGTYRERELEHSGVAKPASRRVVRDTQWTTVPQFVSSTDEPEFKGTVRVARGVVIVRQVLHCTNRQIYGTEARHLDDALLRQGTEADSLFVVRVCCCCSICDWWLVVASGDK